MKKYFLHSNGRHIGPYSAEDLGMMHITASTLVWYNGLPEWKKAGEIPELNSVLAAAPHFSQQQSFQPTFKSAPPVTPYYFPQEHFNTTKKSDRTGLKIVLIIVGVILVIGSAMGYFAYRTAQEVRRNMERSMRMLDTMQYNMPPAYDTSDIGFAPATDSATGANPLFKEIMPEFPGGRNALKAFIRNTIKYPPLARDANIQGTVYVSFTVEKDGTVSNIRIRRGVHPALDREAMRMVEKMPRWKPGTLNGHPVRIEMTQPVRFVLQ